MSGYAKVQELRAKLKPFRKYSGHYHKSPEIKLLLQENVTACQQFMLNKDTTEISTINTKVLLHWAECLYALGRKFGEKKLLPVACEKYEIVAKFTAPQQDDYLVYCKWAIAECELSLNSVFFRDGRGKKALYKRGEALFKQSMTIASKNATKRSRILYSWSLALFRYSRTCETMCTSKEVFRMYQKAGQMFYDAYTVNPNNKDAVYKWGKLLDSQALIIAHRNDPELLLADDVELFLIVFSSLAMRGKLSNLKILIALCLSPEEVTQQMAIKVLEHLATFLDTPSQIPATPRPAPSPPPTPVFTPADDPPQSPFNPSINPLFTNNNNALLPETPKGDTQNTNPFDSPKNNSNPFDSPKNNSNPFESSSPQRSNNPFEKSSPRLTHSPRFSHSPQSSPRHSPKQTSPIMSRSPKPGPNPFELDSPQFAKVQENGNEKESTNPFDVPKVTVSNSPGVSRVSKLNLPPVNNSYSNIINENNPMLSPTTSPAPTNRIPHLLGTKTTNLNGPPPNPASVLTPRTPMPVLDLNLNDSGGLMGTQGDFQSPTVEESRFNQKAIMEEAQSVLVWIRQIIVQNHTLTITTKIQALKSLGEEGQRVWRASKIPYQEALDNFEIFANCINFHTKRQITNLQKYLTAPDDPTSSTSSTPATSPPVTPTASGAPSGPTFPTSLIRSESTPIVKNHWDKDSKPAENGAKEEKPNAENGEKKDGEKNEVEPRVHRSRSFGSRSKEEHEQILIHEDINKFYINHNKIGRGGFGDVYTAKSKKTGKTVAIKSMRRNFEDHFKQIKREIKLMKSSVHPNMVNYIESFICHDHVWIVMEYCDGGSLRHFAKNTILEEPQISYISKQILQALSYLHSHNRIHRDIKADNVLLNLDSSVKLADLGIAADLDDPDTPSELMNLCGSKFWMAPEMIKFKPYNYKVDIWGFGCLLIELAEGRHPYEGQHSMAAMFHTATKGADSLSNPEKWSDLFRDFLAQCFQMNPLLRPSADDLLQHPYIILHDTAPKIEEIKQDIVQRLDNVFVSLQLENILF